MTRVERASCINTIELLRRLALNVHGVIDVVDNQNCDKIIEMLNNPESQWISCSERLPNRDEYIKNNGLFIVSDGNRSYSEWYDIYDKRRFGEPTMSGFRVDYAVTHWMPLPEPYRKENEEDG